MTDLFQILGLPRAFAVEREELERRYRALSREVHPDRFAGAPVHERRLALERQAAVNEAYRTLKDPLKRAHHLLALNGFDIEARDAEGRPALTISPEFLESFLSLRERFEDMEGETARAETRAGVQGERDRRLSNLVHDLERLPEGAPREAVLPLAQRLAELRYFDRFLGELDGEAVL